MLGCLRPLAVNAQSKTTSNNKQASPFEPPSSLRPKSIATPAPIPQPPTPLNTNLELRGIMKWRDVWHFSIHDRSTKESYWISQEGGVEGFEVGEWDEFSGKLRLKDGTNLELKEQSGKPIPIAGRPTQAKKPVAGKTTTTTRPPFRGNIPSPTNRSRTSSSTKVPPPRVPSRSRVVR
jgi:hypothetical protein